MKTFTLLHGEVVKVDDEDYDRVMEHTWRRIKSGKHGYYVAAHMRTEDGREYTMLLQRFLLGLPKGDRRQGDHRNGDKLDNQKENLRILTPSQNQRAFRSKQNGTQSKFRGVSWCKRTLRWYARLKIRVAGRAKVFWLGFHPSEEAAAAAFNRGALKLGFLPECLNPV